jgi:hypothetical protein
MGIKAPRTTLHVPKDTKLFRFLENGDLSKAKWELLEDLIPDSTIDLDYADYKEYIEKVIKRHPDAKIKLGQLWPLISKILKIRGKISQDDATLSDSYFAYLKKM